VNLVNVERLREIAEVEFADIVAETFVPDVNELRIILSDGSFVDVWFSPKTFRLIQLPLGATCGRWKNISARQRAL